MRVSRIRFVQPLRVQTAPSDAGIMIPVGQELSVSIARAGVIEHEGKLLEVCDIQAAESYLESVPYSHFQFVEEE